MARTYGLYLDCRSVTLMHVELPKGKKVRHEIIPWPTGFQTLPDAGGVLDQSYYTMTLFAEFLAGERQASIKRINK